jgi:hypothetical protein
MSVPKRTTQGIVAVFMLKIIVAWFDGEERVYSKTEYENGAVTYGMHRFKQRGDSIIRISQNYVEHIDILEPPECQIWDLQNWYCVENYAQAHGLNKYIYRKMVDGNYDVGGSYYSFDEFYEMNKSNDIMPITFLLGQCRKQFKEHFFYGLIGCPYTFFVM